MALSDQNLKELLRTAVIDKIYITQEHMENASRDREMKEGRKEGRKKGRKEGRKEETTDQTNKNDRNKKHCNRNEQFQRNSLMDLLVDCTQL